MQILITGGAGFVGSNLAERLSGDGHAITVFDDLSAGSLAFLDKCTDRPGFRFIQGDLLDLPAITIAVRDHDAVFHLAANSDIERGRHESDRDFRLGTIATFNVLEAMRRAAVHCSD